MLVVRCTAKLLESLKVTPDRAAPASTALLGDWYANLVNLGRHRFTLCVSEKTLLPVVLEGASGKHFAGRLTAEIARVLALLGVDDRLVQAELAAMREVTYAATASRKVLGSMNDFWNLLEGYWGPGADLSQVALRIAEAPCGPLGMASPERVTRQLFAGRR